MQLVILNCNLQTTWKCWRRVYLKTIILFCINTDNGTQKSFGPRFWVYCCLDKRSSRLGLHLFPDKFIFDEVQKSEESIVRFCVEFVTWVQCGLSCVKGLAHMCPICPFGFVSLPNECCSCENSYKWPLWILFGCLSGHDINCVDGILTVPMRLISLLSFQV